MPPPDTTVVSWLPFYHDMGLMLGIFGPIAYGFHAVLTSPMAFLQKPARWMQLVARNPRPVSPAPNFAYELAVRRTSDEDMAGLDLGHVLSLVTGAETDSRRHDQALHRSVFAVSTFPTPPCGRRTAWPRRRCTLRRRSLAARCPPPVSPTRSCRPATRSAGRRRRCRSDQQWPAALLHRADRRSRRPASRTRLTRSARSGCTVTMSRRATGGTRNSRN